MPTDAPGVGLDLVDVARVRRILARRPEFALRYLAPAERRAWCGRDEAAGLAACLAAKEAFLKALGIGILAAVPLEAVQLLGSVARPRLALGQPAAEALRAAGFDAVRISVSRSGDLCLASVLLVGTRSAPTGSC